MDCARIPRERGRSRRRSGTRVESRIIKSKYYPLLLLLLHTTFLLLLGFVTEKNESIQLQLLKKFEEQVDPLGRGKDN